MFCESPIYIKNPYTHSYMFVDCGHCDVCEINKANSKMISLSNYMRRFQHCIFVTLTYDNSHIPLIFNGEQGIYRGFSDIRIDIDNELFHDDLERFYTFDIPVIRRPYGLRNHDCMGVLFYRDVQLFFKRFRKNNEQFRDFKMFALGEYGTTNFRPHYHIIFMFNRQVDLSDFGSRVCKDWTLCDWSKLKFDECFKTVSSDSASYVSSYVNVNIRNNDILNEKRFRQKTFRSKDITFEVNQECEEALRKYVTRTNSDIYFDGMCQYGEYYDTQQITIPIVNIQSKILFAYFRKFKGMCRLSDDAIFNRLTGILCRFAALSRNGIKLTEFEYSSMDYAVWNCFKRYCKLFGFVISQGSILHYCHNYLSFHNMYRSRQLQRFMLQYVSIDGHFLSKDYAIDCIHSYEEDFGWRRFKYLHKGLDINQSLSPMLHRQISDFKYRYRKRLLPKHISSQKSYNVMIS